MSPPAGKRRRSIFSLAVLLTVPVAALAVSPAFARPAETSRAVSSSTPHPSSTPKASSDASADARFRGLVGSFIDDLFKLYPERATNAGDHRYDDRVDDLSTDGIAERLLFATKWKRNFEAARLRRLSPADEADCRWLIAQTDDVLLWNDEVRTYQREPGIYLPTAAVFSLVARDFAPASVRMRSVTARELASLGNLAAARVNLKPGRTAPVAIAIVLAEMAGTLDFFRIQLPRVFSSVPAGPDKAAFTSANAKLVAALVAYQRWLKDDLMPRASGRAGIGPDAYRRMLADEDMVHVPLDRLDAIGRKELRELLVRFAKTAHEIDPKRSPAEVAASLNRDHPTADRLIPTVSAGLKALRSFVIEHHLAPVPPGGGPIVRETPPFMRATTFASMDTPGPLEKSSEAFFYVTIPDPSWPAARSEQLLEFFSAPLISDTSIHEVYPGHYVQLMNIRLNPDPVRSLFYSGSNLEGWAFYCEQMMLDEGLHKGDPRYRLAQLQMALLRAARYVVALRMHTRGMSVDDAEAFFERNAYMTPNNARVEALRATGDPGSISYELGKLMIIELRHDVRKREGAAFDLGKFHAAFIAQGAIPIPLIRRAMLGSDGPPL
jgi:uncharacterized protein (DUF885 family)